MCVCRALYTQSGDSTVYNDMLLRLHLQQLNSILHRLLPLGACFSSPQILFTFLFEWEYPRPVASNLASILFSTCISTSSRFCTALVVFVVSDVVPILCPLSVPVWYFLLICCCLIDTLMHTCAFAHRLPHSDNCLPNVNAITAF